MEKEHPISIDETSISWHLTNKLRYAKKATMIDESTAKEELMLQQMWQGSDGSEKWEWVEIFEGEILD